MVIYHSVSLYQLLEVIVHRQVFHKDEKAVLVLPDFITDKMPQYRRIAEMGLFDEVYLFPYLKIPHVYRTVVKDTLRSYDELIPYPIGSFDRVYVAGSHFYFSLVPIMRNVDFTAFEDSAGMINNPMFLLKPLKKGFPVHAHFVKKYGLLSFENEHIRDVIVRKRNPAVRAVQTEFSLCGALQELDSGTRSRLIELFAGGVTEVGENTVMLLTEQLSNLNMMTAQQQIKLYDYVCNTVYAGRHIIIKPHPDDKTDYRSFVRDCTLMQRVFPSELLIYTLSAPPALMATVSSAAILAFEDYCPTEVLCRNEEFIKALKKLGIQTKYLVKR